jgi:hypothetical protein
MDGNQAEDHLSFPCSLLPDLRLAASITPACANMKTGLGLLMFVVVWKFEIAEEKVTGFEAPQLHNQK